jgi:hypothetical protein
MKRLFSYYKVAMIAVMAIVVAASLSSTGSASATGDIATNGSFESGFTGWTVSNVDGVGAGWNAYDGAIAVDLNGSSPGYVEQVLDTDAGRTYEVAFAVSANPACPEGTRSLTATAPGYSGIFSSDNDTGLWTERVWTAESFSFTATGTSSTLRFAGTTPAGACGALLDAVVVHPGPAVMYWADWISGSASAGTAVGSITVGTDVVNVNYENPQGYNFIQTGSGIDYYLNGPGNESTSPYTSDSVANIPTAAEMVSLYKAGTQTLTFTDLSGDPLEVANPVFAFVSLNGNGYSFDQDFDILSVAGADGNVSGYFGSGTSQKDVFDLGGGNFEYRLNSLSGEPHGTIRFRGSFDTLSWKSQSDETWNGFTVGIAGLASELPDSDNDGYSDDVDEFPSNPSEWADFDGDSVGDNTDNCLVVSNVGQADIDGDGVGDVCDPTTDLDARLHGTGYGTNPVLTYVTTSDVLADGVDYLVTIEGNWSAWPNLDIAGDCNTDDILFESPSVPSGVNAGLDASFRYRYSGGNDCQTGQWNRVVYRVDSGSSFSPIPRPVNDVYNPDHVYEYVITGAGEVASFTILDDRGSNHGVMKITFVPIVYDADGDGVSDDVDNCPAVANADQLNSDTDAMGDACDADDDNDGVLDVNDAFPTDSSESADSDGDGFGDSSDLFPYDADNDIDGDGLGANEDNCPTDANTDQADLDGDGAGDACDSDIDGDSVPNDNDAFPTDGSEWDDSDGDGVGDNDDPFDNSSDSATVLVGDCDSGVGNQEVAPGAYLSDLLGELDDPANHGNYVGAVSALANEWKKDGLISGRDKGKITSCAAQSDTGRPEPSKGKGKK